VKSSGSQNEQKLYAFPWLQQKQQQQKQQQQNLTGQKNCSQNEQQIVRLPMVSAFTAMSRDPNCIRNSEQRLQCTHLHNTVTVISGLIQEEGPWNCYFVRV
jgi:hypothetical protein